MKGKILKILSAILIGGSLFSVPANADTINYINYGSIVNNNNTINNINNSVNNTNINYSNYNVTQNNNLNPYIPTNNYNNVYTAPQNVNVPKSVTMGQNVAYNNATGTGWIKRNDNELIYFENNIQAINEWKEFPDGYRHFNNVGVMDYNDSIDGLLINDNGTVISYGLATDFMPGLASEKDINYIKHTLDVFGLKYEIEYKDTPNIEEDNKVYSTRGNLKTKLYKITILKYKDRAGFIKY